jgi:hypothetical protein
MSSVTFDFKHLHLNLKSAVPLKGTLMKGGVMLANGCPLLLAIKRFIENMHSPTRSIANYDVFYYFPVHSAVHWTVT